MFNSSVAKVFSREKNFFSPRANNKIYVFISTYLIKLILFIPLPTKPTAKGVIPAKLNRQKLAKLLI